MWLTVVRLLFEWNLVISTNFDSMQPIHAVLPFSLRLILPKLSLLLHNIPQLYCYTKSPPTFTELFLSHFLYFSLSFSFSLSLTFASLHFKQSFRYSVFLLLLDRGKYAKKRMYVYVCARANVYLFM